MAQERIVYIKRANGSQTPPKHIESTSDEQAMQAYRELTGHTTRPGDRFLVGIDIRATKGDH